MRIIPLYVLGRQMVFVTYNPRIYSHKEISRVMDECQDWLDDGGDPEYQTDIFE